MVLSSKQGISPFITAYKTNNSFLLINDRFEHFLILIKCCRAVPFSSKNLSIITKSIGQPIHSLRAEKAAISIMAANLSNVV